MSLRTRLILPVIISSIAVLVACGGGSGGNPPVNPPPSGSFSNSNLIGNYVFSVTGTANDSPVNDFVTIMGVFTADGNGNITGGVLDQNSTASNGLILDTITSGTYSVGSDGRPTGNPSLPTGLLTLQTSSDTFQFDYVLTSSTHGLLTQFENFGSASGSLDLQANVTQADIAGRTYVFNLTGAWALSNNVCGFSAPNNAPSPFATVGAFTLDSNGILVSGVQDFNDNCSSSGLSNVAITAGKVDLTTFPGSATLTTAASATPFTFDVYPIDATHLKFIEIDAQPSLVGDAFTQAPSIPTGNNVFTIAGFDIASNVGGPFTAAGILDFDSNGNVLSDSVEDINDAFLPGQFGSITGGPAITAIASPLTGGRTEITFVTGFVNGNDGIACSSNCIFAAYPSSGGLQMLEIDDGGMTNGIAYLQSATTLASGEGFGMGLSGVTSNSAEDDIAEFTNNNGRFTGIIDFNDQGSTSFKNSFSADYAADAAVAGRGDVSPNSNGFFLATYVVDSNTAVAVSSDQNFVGLGALVKQNSSASSNVVANHLAVLRVNASAHMRKSATKKATATHSMKKGSPTRSK